MTSYVPVSRRCRPLLGTFVEISATGGPGDRLEDRISRAFHAIESVAAAMSFHDPESELSGLNRAPVGEWVRIGASLYEVLSLALELQLQSEGAFNVAIAQPLVHWKLLPGEASETGIQYLARVGFELRDGEARRLLPVQIDLGGIAKGYAVDIAVEAMREDSDEISGIVNAGGDLRVFGESEQEVWVRSGSRADSRVCSLVLRNAALATSTVVADGTVSPYVDPLRGTALLSGATAVARASCCVIADAMTKAALFMPWNSANELAFRYEAELSLLL